MGRDGLKHRFSWLAAVALVLFLGGCAETQFLVSGAKRLSGSTETSTASAEGRYKVGDPYKINGVWYYPKADYEYNETGIASWYGPKFNGRPTANGEKFDMNAISAAHRTLPLPSIVRVTNLRNGRSLKVRVNDRGPFAHGRIIDMSRRGAQLLGFEKAGIASVRVEILPRESRQLAATYNNGVNVLASTKPPPTAAPRVAVTSAKLAPPPGTNSTPPPTNNHKVVVVKQAPKRDVREPPAAPTIDGSVTVVSVPASPKIYVQAGAFTQYDNANRLRARLSLIGPAKIYQVRVVERPLFRVRLGPISSVGEADSMLATVMQSGVGDARIVVD
ncbi:MAG: septal ring lytic transglycosylase RlpA family protein [Alphaproteobacteria bacterium]|nr:septal ring lytic transglycosylase RlpA family protein [Alphaproteobacteria bacterium]